jgi:hypothetical protein
MTMLPVSGASAQAPSGGAPLRCAVEDEQEIDRNRKVCEALSRAIGRKLIRVNDARARGAGDAIQIFGGDVQWIVALLKDGRVHAWTRISKTDAQGKALESIARATRWLLTQKLAKTERCVRGEPRTQRSRSFDVAYPWVELQACATRLVEVPDPWWEEAGRKTDR